MNERHRKRAREALVVLALIALALPASAAFNDTGTMQAWIKSDLQGNQSTNQTIISIPAEISNGGDGLVGLWHFNNGSGNITNDSSGLGNNGECYNFSGQLCNWTAGMFGQGILFDGVDDYVEIADDDSLDFANSGTGDMSIELWFKAEGYNPWQMLIEKYYTTAYYLAFQTNNLNYYLANHNHVIAWTLSNGTWHHLALVMDRDANAITYVNGEVIDVWDISSWSADDWSDGNAVDIGARSGGTGAFNGTIDEVAIYNRSLSAEEIRDHYLGYSIREYSKEFDADRDLVLLMHFDNESASGENYLGGELSDPTSEDGLVGYWRFNNDSTVGENYSGNATVYDYSGDGNNGTIRGSAVKFNGDNDQVNCGNSTSLRPATLTLEAWVKPTAAISSGSSEASVIDYRGQDNTGGRYGYVFIFSSNAGGNSGELELILGGGAGSGWNVYDTTQASWNADQWYHVVVIHDGSNHQFYIDGATEASGSAAAIDYTNMSSFRIGNNLNATIDEVRVYANRTLSADEVMEHYNGQFDDETNLTLWIPFNGTDKGGTTVTDWSGNGNDGTLVGFADTSANAGDGTNSGWTSLGRPNYATPEYGKIGGAFHFNGVDDYINVSASSSIENIFSGGGTVEVWAKPLNAGGLGSGRVVDKTGNAGAGDGWTFHTMSTDVTFLRGFSGGRGLWATTSDPITYNAWNHIAIVYDEDSTANDPLIYVNGVNMTVTESETPSGSADSDENQSLIIGNLLVYTNPFNGSIDEVRIWNRALEASEISNHFNSTAVRDWSDRGNLGQPSSGALEWNSTGRFNGAFEFDGINDYIDAGNDTTLNVGTGSLTMEAWIKIDSITEDWMMITQKGRGGAYPLMDISIRTSGSFAMSIEDVSANSVDSIDDGVLVNDGAWHHVVGVFDRSNDLLIRYVDGTSTGTQNSITAVTDSTDTADSLLVGANLDSSGNPTLRFFNGTIDEVAIWNRSLSADEVREHYHIEGFYGNRTGFVRLHAGNWSLLKDVSWWGTEEWHFVSGSWSSTNLELYVDAVREWNQSKWQGAGNLGNYSYVGNSRANNSGFEGVIDEVSLWNRSLSVGTIGDEFRSEQMRYEVLISTDRSFGVVNYTRLAINNFSRPEYWDDEYTVFLEHFDSIEAIGWNNGTIYGNFSICEGRFGTGGCFDGGTAYVDYGDRDEYNITDQITIEAWIKMDMRPYQMTNQWPTLVYKQGWANRAGYFLGFDTPTSADDMLKFRILDGAARDLLYNSINDLALGNWHHITGTYDGSALRIYIDGALKASNTSVSTTLKIDSTPLRIGMGDSGDYFNGTIDEVRITGGVARIPAKELPNSTHVAVTNLSDETYYWKVRPMNIDDRSADNEQIYGDWSAPAQFYLDSVGPSIYWVRPRDDNGSILGGWFFQNISVFDVNLYNLSCSIYNSSGANVWNSTWDIDGYTNFTIGNWTNISGWPYGVYTENCTVHDATKKKTY